MARLHTNWNFTVIVIFSLTSHVTTTTCERLTVPEVLPEAEGNTLSQHNYVKLEFGQLIQCGIRCMRQRKCKSINYSPVENVCMLNAVDHIEAPAEFLAATGDQSNYVYYMVGQWDQRLLGSCREHSCGEEDICTSRAAGFSPGEARYQCVDKLDSDIVVTCKYVSSCIDCTASRKVQDRWFDPLGCYHSDGGTHVLPTLIESMRGNINWTIGHLDNIINECATLSFDYDLFGLEYYGECYAGKFTEIVAAGRAVNVDECQTLCSWDTGAADVMFVYRWRF